MNRIKGDFASLFDVVPMVSEHGLVDHAIAQAPCGCVGRWILVARPWAFKQSGPGRERTEYVETWVWTFFVVSQERHGDGCARRIMEKGGRA